MYEIHTKHIQNTTKQHICITYFAFQIKTNILAFKLQTGHKVHHFLKISICPLVLHCQSMKQDFWSSEHCRICSINSDNEVFANELGADLAANSFQTLEGNNCSRLCFVSLPGAKRSWILFLISSPLLSTSCSHSKSE